MACSAFWRRHWGWYLDAWKDEFLRVINHLFEYCIIHKISDCGLIEPFNKMLASSKTRVSGGKLIGDVLGVFSQTIEYEICKLIAEDNDFYHTSWEYDGMPGTSTIYDNYWAENPEKVLLEVRSMFTDIKPSDKSLRRNVQRSN